MFQTPMSTTEVKQLSPVTLAFLGDAVYALWVRERLVRFGDGKLSELNRTAANVLSARGQSAFLERVLPLLTQEEEEIFRRGRNAKKPTKSKHATAAEYNRSTGFEAVLGYLYLIGDVDRIETLLSLTREEELKGQAVAKPFKP
ncbi:MAG: Mini-ribonuclease 3 [Clostridia bacterium]|nr:Mini-ribonuclease 3 [Clostridia bacterium]